MAFKLAGKKWLWIGVAAAVVVVAVACVLVFVVFSDDIFGGASGPEATVEKMLDAMAAKDVDAFVAVMDPQALEQLETLMGVDAMKQLLAEGLTYDSLEFTDVKMETEMSEDGQSATVTIVEGTMTLVEAGETTVQDVKEADEPQEYQLVLRDGQWYLDMGSLGM